MCKLYACIFILLRVSGQLYFVAVRYVFMGANMRANCILYNMKQSSV